MESNKQVNSNADELTKDKELEEIKANIKVELSSDYYEAFITIECDFHEIKINREDIMEALNKKNVVYGLKVEVIDDIIQNPREVERLSIAEGDRHENGIDGKIEYHFDVDKKTKPKLLEDGTVDHKELDYILKADEGQILAEKILPIDSKDGKTVTDRVIKGRPGKYFEFKSGKNVAASDDGKYLCAAKSGVIEFENNRISLIEVLEINDNVGVSTGNITFEGKVVVRGNVETGYTINSKDEVEIFGVVEGAEVIAKNIIVHKGIHNSARITCEDNLVCKFMESCYAKVKGDIICDAIIHCDIKCFGKIMASGKKGLILGGNLSVRKEIIAKTIGSQIGSPTRIVLGIDEDLLREIKETKKLIEETKVDLKKINQAIDLVQGKKSKDPKREGFLSKYLEARNKYDETIKNLERKIKNLYSHFESLKNSKISSGQIYAGTAIRINNTHYIVKNPLVNVKLSEQDGEIVISPLV